MSTNYAETGLNLASKIVNVLKNSQKGSLIEYTETSRVEPLVMIDSKASVVPFIGDVLQSVNSIFAGYYLQAVSIMGTVDDVEFKSFLDRLNPKDYKSILSGVSDIATLESLEELDEHHPLQYNLSSPEDKSFVEHFGIEATDSNKDLIVNQKDNIASIRDGSNLAVGKLLNVTINVNGKKASFVIAVRLIPLIVTVDQLVNTLTPADRDTDFDSRIQKWREGRIEFFKDLILCQDLIDKQKEKMIKDDIGIYTDSITKDSVGFLKSLRRNGINVSASNIIVITEQTKKEIERCVRGRLSDFKTREKIFKESFIMLMVVVDPEWEAVTIYHRSIKEPTELVSRDLKNASKGNTDIGEILKAYQLGNSPNI